MIRESSDMTRESSDIIRASSDMIRGSSDMIRASSDIYKYIGTELEKKMALCISVRESNKERVIEIVIFMGRGRERGRTISNG